MSELTDWTDKTCDECDRECRVAGSTEDLQKDPFKAHAHTIAARLRWHLRTHDAEIREQAQREQMEADCKAACYGCNECWPILDIMWHQRPNGDGIGACESWRIRAAYAKAEQQRKGGAA